MSEVVGATPTWGIETLLAGAQRSSELIAAKQQAEGANPSNVSVEVVVQVARKWPPSRCNSDEPLFFDLGGRLVTSVVP